jgi:hypothetical protein
MGRVTATWIETSALAAGDVASIERALGWRPSAFRPATTDRGTSDTGARWIVADSTGPGPASRTAFVKIGATSLTADWIRTEHRNYSELKGSFLPNVLGFADGERRSSRSRTCQMPTGRRRGATAGWRRSSMRSR